MKMKMSTSLDTVFFHSLWGNGLHMLHVYILKVNKYICESVCKILLFMYVYKYVFATCALA